MRESVCEREKGIEDGERVCVCVCVCVDGESVCV